MLLVVCFVLGLLSVPLLGGRLSKLATFTPAYSWAVLLALALQVGIISVFPGAGSQYDILHVVSYALLVAFLLRNRKLPGLWIVGIGTTMNFLVISANGGVMPATEKALRIAGRVVDPSLFANSAAVAHPKLAFFGDVFALPADMPFANVFSAGDVCIVLGALITLHQVCETRFFPPPPEIRPLQPIGEI